MATTRKTTTKKTVEEEIAPQEEASEEKAPEFAPRTVSCEGYDGLYVREEPSVRAEVARILKKGAEVMAAPQEGGWCAVEGGGYVMAEFLE